MGGGEHIPQWSRVSVDPFSKQQRAAGETFFQEETLSRTVLIWVWRAFLLSAVSVV